MVAASKFLPETITDQKRLARGEQLLAARFVLRRNHQKHSGIWKTLILPGNSPHEEIDAIRELMPRNHITALDRDPMCLEKAIDAGADDVMHEELEVLKFKENHTTKYSFAAEIEERRFDLMVIDTCSQINKGTKMLLNNLWRLLRGRGCLIVNFMYGRDVVEMFSAPSCSAELDDRLKELPLPIFERVAYLIPKSLENRVVSVITYMGKVPMVSIVFSKSVWKVPLSFVSLEPGDFELSVTLPDPTKLYALPQERIESLRRSHAAIKAAYTRKQGRLL